MHTIEGAENSDRFHYKFLQVEYVMIVYVYRWMGKENMGLIILIF